MMKATKMDRRDAAIAAWMGLADGIRMSAKGMVVASIFLAVLCIFNGLGNSDISFLEVVLGFDSCLVMAVWNLFISSKIRGRRCNLVSTAHVPDEQQMFAWRICCALCWLVASCVTVALMMLSLMCAITLTMRVDLAVFILVGAIVYGSILTLTMKVSSRVKR